MISKTEEEIIRNWSKDSDVLVSIMCVTYNHEKYISQCLDGFLMQKTTFPFDIIVHDDKSTDNTANIIKEYEKKFPRIIKPIYEIENQYSKGNGAVTKIITPYLDGKYIAICEGDDYWTDPQKLQKQVDFLEKNEGYVACTHNTVRIVDGKKNEIMFGDKEKDIVFTDVVVGGISCYHTSSLVQKKEYISIPKEFYERNVGDYPRSLYLTISGKVHYFGECMSAYRFMSGPTSWSSKVLNDKDKLISQLNDEKEMLSRVDDYCCGKYHKQIRQRIRDIEVQQLKISGDYQRIYRDYKDYLNKSDIKGKIKYLILGNISFISRLYIKYNNKYK